MGYMAILLCVLGNSVFYLLEGEYKYVEVLAAGVEGVVVGVRAIGPAGVVVGVG